VAARLRQSAVLEKSKLERWQPFSMERGPGN
jgi:hypothetical protein